MTPTTCSCIVATLAKRGDRVMAYRCVDEPCYCHQRGCPLREEFLKKYGARAGR